MRAVGAIYARELQALGFETRWVDLPAGMQRGGHLVATHRGGNGPAPAADRPSRHGAAGRSLPARWQSRLRHRHLRHERRQPRGAGSVAGTARHRPAARHERHGHLHRRRGRPGRAARGHARCPAGRRTRRRHCAGLRGRQSRQGRDRPPRHWLLEPGRDRRAGPLVRDLWRGTRSWRDLRSRPHPRAVPHGAAGTEPDLQPVRDRRRHRCVVRQCIQARHGARQDQCHPARGARRRRHPLSRCAAVRRGPAQDGADRDGEPAAHDGDACDRQRLSVDGAKPRQRAGAGGARSRQSRPGRRTDRGAAARRARRRRHFIRLRGRQARLPGWPRRNGRQ